MVVPTPASRLQLLLDQAGGFQRTIDLVPGLILGRAPEHGCVLADGTVSSCHAEICLVEGHLAIRDLGSTNGTRIEGGPKLRRGESHPLRESMRIGIGGCWVTVIESTSPEQASSSVATLRRDEKREGSDTRAFRRDELETIAKHPRLPAPAAPSRAATDLSATMTRRHDREDLVPAVQAAVLELSEPRLVHRHRHRSGTAPITSARVLIGRKVTPEIEIEFPDDGISQPHACISIGLGVFWIEDLGSTNHTHLDGKLLQPRIKTRLEPDAWLKLGHIDLLFITNQGEGTERFRREEHVCALDILEEWGVLGHRPLECARAGLEAGRHPVEELILEGALGVVKWHESLAAARLRLQLGPAATARGSRLLVLVLHVVTIVLLFAVLALLILILSRTQRV